MEKAAAYSHLAHYSRLEYYLGFLETSEAALELAASVAAGEAARWAVVAAVQLMKAVLRLMLVLRQRRMVCSPAVEAIDREEAGHEERSPSMGKPEVDQFVRLSRSGRRLRTIRAGEIMNCSTVLN